MVNDDSCMVDDGFYGLLNGFPARHGGTPFAARMDDDWVIHPWAFWKLPEELLP